MCAAEHVSTAACRCCRRLQDVRLTEIDKVEVHSCFRPGDLVRAEVRAHCLSVFAVVSGLLFKLRNFCAYFRTVAPADVFVPSKPTPSRGQCSNAILGYSRKPARTMHSFH